MERPRGTDYLNGRFERYKQCMDSSVADKLLRILPHLEKYEGLHNPVFLSIGSGTGGLEQEIVHHLPNATLIALDLSLPMLETIPGNHSRETIHPHQEIWRVQANARALPFKNDSVNAVIASSVVHEIASYENNMRFGPVVESFFRKVARVLKPGGRLIVRDFIQSDYPHSHSILTIGRKKRGDEFSPEAFVERFVERFRGDDLEYIKKQIDRLKERRKWRSGAALYLENAHLFEILAHFSWAQSFEVEVKEKYGYLSQEGYSYYLQRAFSTVRIEGRVIHAETYLQDGYREHLKGRFRIFSRGQEKDLPDITGIIVVEKTGKAVRLSRQEMLDNSQEITPKGTFL